jgi:hypothetical protein
VTMRELREGSVAEMVARIAREHSEAAAAAPETELMEAAPEVAEAPSVRHPRRPARLFPDAPDLHE